MSITDSRELPLKTAEDKRQELRDIAIVRQRAALLEHDPEAFARMQGEGIAEHLQEFVRGNEPHFKRYFAIDANSHHAQIHQYFLESVQNKFPVMNFVDDGDDTRLLRVEFAECGAGLLARVDYDSEGDPFGIQYEGYVSSNQPPEMLGRIATGLAMS